MIEKIRYNLDSGLAGRASVALVALATDHTIEYEFRKILDLPDVGFYVTRVQNEITINPETLAAMESRLKECAAVILPGVKPSVVAFGCTSAATVIGEDNVAARIREARPGVPVTTPVTAVVAALEALALENIAVITPYRDDVNEELRNFLEARGISVVSFGSFKQADDNLVARISPETIREAILSAGRKTATDGVFLSCTNLRLAEQAAELEAVLGKPVVSSNLAMAWHCLRLSGVRDKIPGFGQLYNH